MPLAAADESRREHALAAEFLTGWPAAGFVAYTSGQIVHGIETVVTANVADFDRFLGSVRIIELAG